MPGGSAFAHTLDSPRETLLEAITTLLPTENLRATQPSSQFWLPRLQDGASLQAPGSPRLALYSLLLTAGVILADGGCNYTNHSAG